ncbi:hypothetical protein ACO2IY_13050, partial [Leptospira interrogans]
KNITFGTVLRSRNILIYGRSKKLSVSLLWSLEETQRLASMVARRELSVSYIELVLFKRLRVLV